ncbi:hypothetical protein FACS1894170_00120 [Planctomycetales bacterium]|nr:hypothetical protein FACS1894170_00120 [Planctomycetales bacterium]
MANRIERVVTMGDRYVLAIMTYLGIALLMVGTTLHGDTNAYAQTSGGCTHTVMQEGEPVTLPGCESGEICCGGACIDAATQQCCSNVAISQNEICCGDGTHGSQDTCGCCDSCGDTTGCANPVSTVVCDPVAP